MFTGLVQDVGTIAALKKRGASARLTVRSALARRLKTGDSIAVSGVCLTALNIGKASFSADLAQETIARTSLSRLKAGALVNLELPAKAGEPLGGHIVQGHVDGIAQLVSLERIQGAEDWRLVVELPLGLERYVVPKGSIAMEGISLTVAAIAGRRVEIAIIPHTYSVTNLRTLTAGALLNIEVDVLAKYAERMFAGGSAVTIEKLLEEGF